MKQRNRITWDPTASGAREKAVREGRVTALTMFFTKDDLRSQKRVSDFNSKHGAKARYE